jgi:tRNA threonylcarbamoyladenosine biosynthesis protein TsaB
VKILAVDTALGALSAALAEDGAVAAHAFEEMVRGHAEALAPMVERLMREAGWTFAAIDRIAVTTGPGTFTGQRVGLAFARALALALKKPAVGITTLDAMAAQAIMQSGASFAIAAADAKRGEIYLGARTRERTLLPPELIALAEAPARIANLAKEFGTNIVIAGTAAEMLISLLQQQGLDARDSHIRQPDAVWVAQLGAREEAVSSPRPLYLRPPDAKLPVP